jgi:hypothetical protein
MQDTTMERRDPMLRVKVPCRDEGDFWARLADHVATNGIRVPAEAPRPVGTRVRVGLEFKDGRTLSGDGVVDSHVDLDPGRAMCVRFLKLDRVEQATAAPGAANGAAPPPVPPAGPPALPGRDEPLEEELFGDLPEGAAAPAADPFNASAEIMVEMARRGARLRRVALWIAAAALAVAVLGTVAARRLGPSGEEALVGAHVAAADRLLAEGRLVGEDGALERLLAAQRLRPGDRATAERLSRAADLLERLGATALDRGDLRVASIHLAGARLAAPDRASIRAKLATVERARAAGARRR